MTAPAPKRCLMCGQPIKTEARRVCFDCKLPIQLHDKWMWAERNSIPTCVHRHCDVPTSYTGRAGE
jgi:hypothetical protein